MRKARFAWLVPLALAAGCYAGTARPTSPAALAREPGWRLVGGVPEIRQVGEKDCGPAAAAMVMTYWGQPRAPGQIRARSGVPAGKGVVAGRLRDAIRHEGLDAYLVEGTFADLDREIAAGRPVIVGQAKPFSNGVYAHYVVVVGMNRARMRVAVIDPAQGWQEDSLEGFEKEWAPAGRLTMVVFPRADDVARRGGPPARTQ